MFHIFRGCDNSRATYHPEPFDHWSNLRTLRPMAPADRTHVFHSQRRFLRCIAFVNPSSIGTHVKDLNRNAITKSRPQSFSKRHPTRCQLLTLPTGVKMEVIAVPAKQAASEASKGEPALVFVHGSLHAAWCFRFFQAYYSAKGFETYAVSLRGAGNTEAPLISNPTVEEHVSDLSALLSSLNLSAPPVVIGHSIGGFIVQKWAEQESPASFSAMVLLSSTPPTGNSSLARRIMFKDGVWKTIRITMGFVRRTVAKDVKLCREMFFSPQDIEWYSEDLEGDQKLQEYMELFQKTSKTLDVKSLKNIVQGTGCMKGKVFVMGGSADSLVDVTALEETASFWDGDLVVLKDAPHDIMLYSKWEEAASKILTWITENVSRNRKSTSLLEAS